MDEVEKTRLWSNVFDGDTHVVNYDSLQARITVSYCGCTATATETTATSETSAAATTTVPDSAENGQNDVAGGFVMVQVLDRRTA